MCAYKIFAKLLHNILSLRLEAQQSDEQMGFRPKRSIEDALLILESIVSKSLEWNMPIWIISIDLKKAFDRVEYRTLFAALEEQGVESGYIQLLQRLYANQRGTIGNASFSVRRGVPRRYFESVAI